MPKWSSEQEARQVIKNLITSYYHEYVDNRSQFQPGDRIAYAGRVFDEKEMCGLTDALLDFWLTTGRFTERFEKEFGVRYVNLVNSGSSANLIAFSAAYGSQIR